MVNNFYDLSSDEISNEIENNLWDTYNSLGKSCKYDSSKKNNKFILLNDVSPPFFNVVIYIRKNATYCDLKCLLNKVIRKSVVAKVIFDKNARNESFLNLLKEYGVFSHDKTVGMAIQLDNVIIDNSINNVEIKPVIDIQYLNDWIKPVEKSHNLNRKIKELYLHVYQELGFNTHQWRHYTAYIDNQPIGSVSLFLNGKTAGLYNVSVLPEMRYKGIGTYITSYALKKAYEAGYTIGVLNSSQIAVNMYMKLGFKSYFNQHHYIYNRLLN